MEEPDRWSDDVIIQSVGNARGAYQKDKNLQE
jgi:hypothetical protein